MPSDQKRHPSILRSPFDDQFRFNSSSQQAHNISQRLSASSSVSAGSPYSSSESNASSDELNYGTLSSLPGESDYSRADNNMSCSFSMQSEGINKPNSSRDKNAYRLQVPNSRGRSVKGSIKLKQAHVDFTERQVGDSSDSLNSNIHNGFSKDEGLSGKNNPKRSKTIFRRDRWGTQRYKSGRPRRKGTLRRGKTVRKVMDSIPHARKLFSRAVEDDFEPPESSIDEKDRSMERRQVYWNLPLPSDKLDEDGNPPFYPRNKIRTTKYTPLSFLPKNLYYQFKNVANIYFLTMIVLGFFNIFGVPNPALSAVPLIVIVIITAFKDALEDSRRTASDMKINNMITHVAKGINNPNFNGENVSLWRKFKKLNTRIMIRLLHKIKRQPEINPLAYDSGPRKSLDSFDYRQSLDLSATDMSAIAVDPFGDSQTCDPQESHMAADPEIRPFAANKDVHSDDHPIFRREYWKNVHVGDVLKIKNNDQIPVDVLILSTSDSDGGCYVETKNLDGETNLKVKQALKCSSTYIRNVRDLTRCKFWLESEGPKANLYNYEGNLKYYVHGDENGEVANEPVTINNLLLRGCSLRNTKWVVGIVVFTGSDTKIMLNAGITPTKRSRISKELNWQVVVNFTLLFVICFVSGVLNGLYYRKTGNSREYFEYGSIAGSPTTSGIVGFFVAVILYQSLVPISLYISIEIVKTAQAYFIYSDVKMYNKRLDYPCVPKSWNMSDDLGQIEYIFSDKTGTLTQNVMEFKKCSVNGTVYGRAYTEAYADIRRRQGVDVEQEAAREKKDIAEDKSKMIGILSSLNKNDVDKNDIDRNLTFVSRKFAEDLNGNSGEHQKTAAENFCLALALCHSVLIERSEKPPYNDEFRAQSPDEAALVATVRDLGFAFVGRTKSGIILDVQGVRQEYRILNILEFNSNRKRMSVIIKVQGKGPDDPPKALLICKGADSVIFSRLHPNNSADLLEKTAIHLEQFASEGLRTLCVAKRELTWKEYEVWNQKHDLAASSLEDRDDKMEKVASEIERQLTLLGGTAIEDRLQDGVPESIQLLAKAGIKLWVLTGDKVETAINIGFSCNLLQNSMELLVIKTNGDDIKKLLDPDEWNRIKNDKSLIVSSIIKKYLKENFGMQGTAIELEARKKIHRPPSGNNAIVIDGDALKMALADENEIKFLLLCMQCNAVLCCRVSPAQKAGVVKLVKEKLDVMTLAIGDGSNDVAMIQAANVGVGIMGEEGAQAAMSSDYAIGQFRYLSRLILVHGRWSYKRLAEMIPSFFYKNVVFTLALFWYGIYDNFDGTYLFEYTYLMFYNLAFTSLPVIFLGIFDQDVDDRISMIVPQLYRSGILRQDWNIRKFVWYMIDGIYQSVICYFLPFLLYYKATFLSFNGLTLDHRYLMGALVSSISIISCDTYVLAHQKRWDWLSVLITSLSIIIVFAWTGIWSSSYKSDAFYKSADELYSSLAFWACLWVGFWICVAPRFSYDFVATIFRPKDIDIIREKSLLGEYDKYPPGYDPTDPERPAILKDGGSDLEKQSLSESDEYDAQISHPLPVEENAHRSVFSRLLNKKPARADIGNGSHDSLETEEIELDFSPTANAPSKSKRLQSLDRTRSSMEYSRTGEGDGRETSLDRVRTSLDLPGVETANSLMERLSK